MNNRRFLPLDQSMIRITHTYVNRQGVDGVIIKETAPGCRLQEFGPFASLSQAQTFSRERMGIAGKDLAQLLKDHSVTILGGKK